MGNLQPWRIPCVSAWRIPCVSEVGMIIKNSSLGHEEDKDKITKKKKWERSVVKYRFIYYVKFWVVAN